MPLPQDFPSFPPWCSIVCEGHRRLQRDLHVFLLIAVVFVACKLIISILVSILAVWGFINLKSVTCAFYLISFRPHELGGCVQNNLHRRGGAVDTAPTSDCQNLCIKQSVGPGQRSNL